MTVRFGSGVGPVRWVARRRLHHKVGLNALHFGRGGQLGDDAVGGSHGNGVDNPERRDRLDQPLVFPDQQQRAQPHLRAVRFGAQLLHQFFALLFAIGAGDGI
ncbi:MAG: hypothetical protein R2911_00925 [Caldilineaceae bacterium]